MVTETLVVLHEDEWLLAVDKPPGLLSHPVRAQDDSLAERVRARLGAESAVHLVHRLDRDTSGIVLIAREPRIHRRLQGQRAAGKLAVRYVAFAAGSPEFDSGVIDAPIGRNPQNPPLRGVVENGAPARTRYRVLERYDTGSMLELELDTGRTHQIRVHLEHAGFPILGDRWYGRRGLDLIDRQALHASRVSFRHPVTRDILSICCPVPPEIERLRSRLRAESDEAAGYHGK
jgi:RluA family pseudouridine synthase